MSRVIRPASQRWSRREFLRQCFWSAGAVGGSGWLAACGSSRSVADVITPIVSRFAGIGPLLGPDANGLRLPAGFSSRVLAVSGLPVLPGLYLWHIFPDGGATYATPDGGWIYTSNSEMLGVLPPAIAELLPVGAVPLTGGVGALKFDAQGNLVDAYPILTGTRSNCAGGKTPWGTWLSCEETDDGIVYECDPFQAGQGTAHPALGRFAHEAAVVDPQHRLLYLTEDEGDGRFYRFVPGAADWPAGSERPMLAEGQLQALRYAELELGAAPPEGFDVSQPHAVVWDDVAMPEQAQGAVRESLAGAGQPVPGTPFRGGEGLWHFRGITYFSTKSDNRIWAYDAGAGTLETIYDFATASPDNAILSGVDNLTVSEFGDVLVAEDGGDMQIGVILPDRRVLPLVQASDLQAGTELQSEITGPAFSPDGRRLYFSAQRSGRNGLLGAGITFEVMLPFSACPAGCP